MRAPVWIVATMLTFAGALAAAEVGPPSAEPAPGAADKPAASGRSAEPASSHRPEPSARIARLIRALGARDYAARQSADDDLARLGSEARSQLEAALDSDDAETRLRARELIDRVKVAELWAPTLVDLSLERKPVSEGFAATARQTGNHLVMGDAHVNASETLVDVFTRATPFWEAVDELCRKSGNHVRPNYDSHAPGLIVASGAPGRYPTAYSGPLRVQMTSARRLFTEELDYETGKSTVTHSFLFNLQMTWEDRFHLAAYTSGPTLVEAVPEEGKPPVAVAGAGGAWLVTNGRTRQVTASLRISPPPIASKTLSLLRLKWGLVALGDMQTARIEPLAAGLRYQRGDLLVTVEKVERETAGRCELTLWVARELAVPETQDILLEENSIELFDQRGKSFRELSHSNSLGDGGVQMKMSFTGDSADSEPTTLAIAYPRLRSRREVEIVFRGAPLPTGHPE